MKKNIILSVVCLMGLFLSHNVAYACDDAIILEKAKKGQITELSTYLKKCRVKENKEKNDAFQAIIESFNPVVLTKEDKEEQIKKDKATQAERKRIRDKVKSSFRSTENLDKSSRWNDL